MFRQSLSKSSNSMRLLPQTNGDNTLLHQDIFQVTSPLPGISGSKYCRLVWQPPFQRMWATKDWQTLKTMVNLEKWWGTHFRCNIVWSATGSVKEAIFLYKSTNTHLNMQVTSGWCSVRVNTYPSVFNIFSANSTEYLADDSTHTSTF